MIQKFLVQIEDGADTRWKFSEKHFVETLERCSQFIVRYETEGTIPIVTVLVEESTRAK